MASIGSMRYLRACDSALPAIDLVRALERPSFRAFEAFVATFLEVCFLLGIVFTSSPEERI